MIGMAGMLVVGLEGLWNGEEVLLDRELVRMVLGIVGLVDVVVLLGTRVLGGGGGSWMEVWNLVTLRS
jgi:hypothetical protein